MTTFTLDGRTVSVARGRTLLDACREHRVHVPTLCHLDGVSAVASCRVCLVEVQGLGHPVPACATVAEDGMEVATDTETLRSHRRFVVELLFAGGQHVCAFCPASGRCELQELASEVGLDHLRYQLPGPAPALDASRPRFALDPARCVLCTRCVRVCAEVEHAHTLGVTGRGAHARLFTDGGGRWGSSATCTDCGKCVTACPTGALFEKVPAAQGLEAGTATRPVAGAWAARSPRAEVEASARVPAPVPAPLPVVGPALRPASPGGFLPGGAVRRPRVATVWLGGCSGCHMSLLDLDERLLELAPRMEVVYSPLVDAKEYPEGVDLCLVEGAVASEEHLALVGRIRERTRVLVALGDCAASGNVTAMRDAAGGAGAVLRRAWADASGLPPARDPVLPALLERVRPLHEVVRVDLFVPGCPPSAGAIHQVLSQLLAGRRPDLTGLVHLG